jgi:deazaflavin-dependent oxidoreductase (nitroreductase family)
MMGVALVFRDRRARLSTFWDARRQFAAYAPFVPGAEGILMSCTPISGHNSSRSASEREATARGDATGPGAMSAGDADNSPRGQPGPLDYRPPRFRLTKVMALSGEYEPSPSAWARDQVELYESSGGTDGLTLQGRPVVVVTSIGAKTGKIRKTPLMRVEYGGRYALVASQGGAPTHPVWYHNLIANPRVDLQDGPVKKEYAAREVSGDERNAWWDRAVEAWPDYASYRERTSRTIPVFVLSPLDEAEQGGTEAS